MNILKSLILLFCMVSIISCEEKTRSSKSKKINIPFTKEGQAFIQLEDKKITVDIEVAKTDYETQTGLMYRDSMSEKQGMLFLMKKEQILSFWMKNTRIHLDIIYIDKNQKVVNIVKNAKPFQTKNIPTSKKPALYVLELNGGMCDKWGIKEGSFIDWKIGK